MDEKPKVNNYYIIKHFKFRNEIINSETILTILAKEPPSNFVDGPIQLTLNNQTKSSATIKGKAQFHYADFNLNASDLSHQESVSIIFDNQPVLNLKDEFNYFVDNHKADEARKTEADIHLKNYESLKSLIESCTYGQKEDCFKLKTAASNIQDIPIESLATKKLCRLGQDKYCTEMIEKFDAKFNLFASLNIYAPATDDTPQKGILYFADYIKVTQKINGGYLITNIDGNTRPSFIVTNARLTPDKTYSGFFTYEGDAVFTGNDGFEKSIPKFKLYKKKANYDWKTYGYPIQLVK